MIEVAASATKALIGLRATPRLAPARLPIVFSQTSSSSRVLSRTCATSCLEEGYKVNRKKNLSYLIDTLHMSIMDCISLNSHQIYTTTISIWI
jgi:hypothetical protein